MVSGGAQFWSGYAAFAVFDVVLGMAFWPAKIISYFLGASVNFGLERFWVFGGRKVSKKQVKSSAERYYSLMFVNFLLDLAIVGGLRELGVTPYIGQFVSAGFFTFFNYALFKFWVFKRKRPSPSRPAVRRSRPHRRLSRAAAVSKAPVLTQSINYTPRSALRFFLASVSSERHLKRSTRKND